MKPVVINALRYDLIMLFIQILIDYYKLSGSLIRLSGTAG